MNEQKLKQRANPNNYDSFMEWAKANKWSKILSPIYLVFGLVVGILSLIAKLTGITYKEMNIFVYYFVFPISWCIMIDHSILGYIRIPISTEPECGTSAWFTFPMLSSMWCALWAIIIYINRHGFRAWCVRAFDNSVIFLLWFRTIGWNYYVSSVIICVVVPILIYSFLIYLCC